MLRHFLICVIVLFCTQDLIAQSNGLLKVKRNNKWGWLDQNGTEVIKCEFDSIIKLNLNNEEQTRWFAIVNKNNKSILINDKGGWIADFPYLQLEPFSSGMAAVLDTTNHWGFIDTSFSLKIPCKYSYIPDYCIMTWRYPPKFSGSNCLVSITDIGWGIQGTFGIINTKGEEVTPRSNCFFDLPPKENYFAVICSQNGKYGLIDHNLKLVVDCIYEEFYLPHFQPFELYSECRDCHYFIKNDDHIPARLNNKWGYISVSGVVKIPFLYEQVSDFENGKAAVLLNGVEITIDKMGTILK